MRLRALTRHLFWGDTAAERGFGLALLLVAVGLGVFLRLTGSEWREAVDTRIAKTEKKWAEQARAFATPEERGHALFKSVKLEQRVHAGLYWAGLLNLVLAGALILTRRWWIGRDAKRADSENCDKPEAEGRRSWFWLWIGAAVLLALVLRLPRMDLSLYNDEAYNFRHYIHGQFLTEADGSTEFKRVTWTETLWKNKANNNVAFSSLARVCDSAWRSGAAAADGQINETALRWPALLPGLVSIVVVALLGRRLFGGLAGGAAAFFLALHPWHLRYCTEARPYGLVMLCAALMLLCLVNALANNRWRWWLGFGAAQFGLMWAFAGAIYFAAGINGAALVLLWRRGVDWRQAASGRLIVANLLSAMVYLQLMAPCFPQMAHTLQTVDSFRAPLGLSLVGDIASYLATGMPAVDRDPTNAFNPALAKFWPGGWWMLLPAIGALTLLALLACAVLRRPGVPRTLLYGHLLALLFALAATAATGAVLHRWYIIYLLPFTAVGLAAGGLVLWKTRRAKWLACALPLFILLLVQGPLRDYRRHGKESLREIAATAAEGGALVAGFWTDSAVYDPAMRRVRTADDLRALAAEAKADGRALAVVFGHRKMAESTMPECVRLVAGPDGLGFELVAVFPGLEEAQFTSFVYRLEPGG